MRKLQAPVQRIGSAGKPFVDAIGKRLVDLINQTPGTIGYAELAYTKQNNLPVASIENQGGAFVAPSAASTAAAVQAFSDALAKDPRAPIVNPPASAKDAYPISGLTFFLVREDAHEVAAQQAVKDFIAYTISNGQDMADGLSYAKLPAAVQQRDQALLGELTSGGHPLD